MSFRPRCRIAFSGDQPYEFQGWKVSTYAGSATAAPPASVARRLTPSTAAAAAGIPSRSSTVGATSTSRAAAALEPEATRPGQRKNKGTTTVLS